MKIISSVLLVLFVLSACTVNVDFDYTTFQSERQSWQDQNISNYSYTFYSAGFFLENYLYLVSNDVVSWATNLDLLSGNTNTGNNTIDDLYAEIESVYLNNQGKSRGIFPADYYIEKIRVTYDPVFHYPTQVSYIPFIPSSLEVDGNFAWSITAFTN